MNRDLVKGMVIGVGVGLVGPMVFPAMARAFRPGVSAAIRAGVIAWERSREQLAEWGEYAEDMAAEAKAGAAEAKAGAAEARAGRHTATTHPSAGGNGEVPRV